MFISQDSPIAMTSSSASRKGKGRVGGRITNFLCSRVQCTIIAWNVYKNDEVKLAK